VVAKADAAAKGTSKWSEKVSKAEQKTAQLKSGVGALDEQFGNIGSGPGGGSAGRAAEKIRTLTDYANDLSSVFSRAFEIRFSSGTALDAIAKSFSSISKSNVLATLNSKLVSGFTISAIDSQLIPLISYEIIFFGLPINSA
jgi:hypothetical protein